jgi:hypothetical protein
MFTSYQQDAVQIHNRKTANKSFQNVAKFEYLGGTLTNQNLINEDIMSRPNIGKICYNFVILCRILCLSVWPLKSKDSDIHNYNFFAHHFVRV